MADSGTLCGPLPPFTAEEDGTPDATRTRNLRLRRPTLPDTSDDADATCDDRFASVTETVTNPAQNDGSSDLKSLSEKVTRRLEDLHADIQRDGDSATDGPPRSRGQLHQYLGRLGAALVGIGPAEMDQIAEEVEQVTRVISDFEAAPEPPSAAADPGRQSTLPTGGDE